MAFTIKKMPENPIIQDEILSRNINNMFYLSIYMICSECFMLISFIGIKDKLPSAYQSIYFGMYMFLLLFAVCSAVFLFPRKKRSAFENSERKVLSGYTIVFVVIQIIPLALLFLMLPFFQKNSSIILGHYINLAALLIPLTISSFRSLWW